MIQILSICALITLIYFGKTEGRIQCMDENNSPVDWYVVLKLPKIEQTEGYVSKGEAFMYITSKSLDQGWTWSGVGIQDRNTLLANTLKLYYSNKTEDMWILYNDENPNRNNINFGGHTKGVVGADDKGGIWLVHSIPKYPPSFKDGYGYPHSGLIYGQSALCISLTQESLNIVGKGLAYNDPDIYDNRTHSTLFGLYPHLDDLVKKVNISQTPWYFTSQIVSLEGTTFTMFAKADLFGKDLYDLVSTKLHSDLLVETWQNEEDPLPSTCFTPFEVMNIKGIAIKDRDLYYRSSKDHSKWAIGSLEMWTCIGDINRAGPQKKRGGGTVCINNKQLWHQYHKLVDRVEDCKTKRNHYKG